MEPCNETPSTSSTDPSPTRYQWPTSPPAISSSSERESLSPKSSSKPSVPLDQILECTICLDVSASPIHTCGNGHVICGFCYDRVKKCGQCGDEELHVDNLAERLSRQFEMDGPCDNHASGCHAPIKYSVMKNHTKLCEYRNIKCNGYMPMCVEPVTIKAFLKHLKDVHGCAEVVNGSSGYFILNNVQIGTLTQRLISYDNHDFIWNLVRRNDLVYWWVIVCGGKKEASNYHYETRVVPLKPQSPNGVTCIWELPVLPFHGYEEFKTSKEGLYTSVTFSTLSRFFLVGNGSAGNSGLEIAIKIISLENEPEFNLDLSSAELEFKSLASAGDGPIQRRPTTAGRQIIKSRRQLVRL